MNAEEKQYRRMTETTIPRLVGSLSLPTVISMLVTSIYNIVDTYFVSQLGTNASGAVGIVFSVQALIQAVGFGLGMGSGSLCSLCLGKKDGKSASKYASSAFLCAILFGLLLFLLSLGHLDSMMRLFGSNDEILPYACDYGFYILLGAPLMCSSFVLNNLLRSEGLAKQSMIGLTAGGILNIILDPLFIFDRGLDLGCAGAALATILSQAMSFAILLSFFLRKKTIIHLHIINASRHFSDYFTIIKTGAPTVCRQGLASLATTLLNWQARPWGSAAIAAMTLANRIYMIARNIVIGIGQGYQPVAGYNYGAGKCKRVKNAFWVAVAYGTAFSTLAALILAVFAPQVISLFRRDDPNVIRYGSLALRLLCLELPFLAYSVYVNQTFQALGKVWRATLLASMRSGILFVPLIITMPHYFGLLGVQLAQPLADFLTVVVSVPLHILFFRQLSREEALPKAAMPKSRNTEKNSPDA